MKSGSKKGMIKVVTHLKYHILNTAVFSCCAHDLENGTVYITSNKIHLSPLVFDYPRWTSISTYESSNFYRVAISTASTEQHQRGSASADNKAFECQGAFHVNCTPKVRQEMYAGLRKLSLCSTNPN